MPRGAHAGFRECIVDEALRQAVSELRRSWEARRAGLGEEFYLPFDVPVDAPYRDVVGAHAEIEVMAFWDVPRFGVMRLWGADRTQDAENALRVAVVVHGIRAAESGMLSGDVLVDSTPWSRS